jgi:hypothetical protein
VWQLRGVCTLVLLLILGMGRAFGAEATTGGITGVVVDMRRAPVPNARLSAAAPAGTYATTSDAHGRFALLGMVPGTYVFSVEAPGFGAIMQSSVSVAPGEVLEMSFHLERTLQTIGQVRAPRAAFTAGATSDQFTLSDQAALAHTPTTSSAGLGSYLQGTAQGAIANVPGVDLDPFANAVVRSGGVSDTVFDYDAVPIPQGLIVEPGGNIDGAQLPTTGVASTDVTLAGYSNESDNALGGVVDQIPAVGRYPARTTLEVADGAGTQYQLASLQILDATRDLKWRYALAGTVGSEYLSYGDGKTFYPSEAATYGLALQSRSQYSIESNVHARLGAKDDISFLALVGEAAYNQYASPFAGETVGQFSPGTPFPGETNPNAPVTYASGVRGSYDILKAAWQHRSEHFFTRAQLYNAQYGSSAGGPFWDENGFPNGAISLSEQSSQRQVGLTLDSDGVIGPHHLIFGAEYRSNTSALNQVVPTAGEFITSNPTLGSYLAYVGDTWSATSRLRLSATARVTGAHVKPSAGAAYDTGAIDPHLGLSYRFKNDIAFRATFDHTTVAPAPLEADRTDSADATPTGSPAPFVQLNAQTGNDFTYSLEGGGRIPFRLTYYQKFEQNLIDVLPFNFRSAVSAGLNPDGVGVPTNIGKLQATGFEFYGKAGGLTLQGNLVRAFSSSASQFAFNDLNAPAIAAGHLFPVGYEPDFTADLAYEFDAQGKRLRISPSLAFSTGYPYGDGKMVYIFDPTTNKPVAVPNDNFVNPGANYYFLTDPSKSFNAATNPYIGNLGTNEGNDPNSLRSPAQAFVNLHLEGDVSPRLTLVLDVINLLGNFSPTAYQSNPYLIGPPGYKGNNAVYANCYGQILAGTVHSGTGKAPCASGLPAGVTPYTLGNGVPTNDGTTQSVPWSYGTAAYVPQSYPLGRTLQIRLRYRL